MKTKFLSLGLVTLMALVLAVACSNNNNRTGVSEDQVKNQLQQAGLNNVDVNVDNDKKVVRLQGDVQTENQKNQAEQIAKSAAPSYVVANEIGVRPEGADNAGQVSSNLDDGIKSDWKALEAKNQWGNQHINADVNNGVLTLKGDVDTPALRQQIEKEAAKIPNVTQVVNELDVKAAKRHKKAASQTASE